MKNNTKKTVTPAFTVDITDCETVEDLIIKIADAKLSVGLCISEKELEAILDEQIELVVEETIEQMFDGHNALILNEDGEIEHLDAVKVEVNKKRPNVLKRFWNWITRK